jgi:O-antigen chain-terminating methyltransferase
VTSDFYRAFEDRHRGSRELIKSRLQIYVPFIQPLLAQYPGGHAVDLGCGRGEWLELGTELGLSTTGVDLDDGMLAACRERGLNVITGDGLALLKSLPDDSQVVVSGFHFAEHIPFDSLQALVKEALRVLQPGGLLILETPNPENIAVGTCHFYLDPSHQRPIPPQLLAFLPEYQGFARTKILRLQESPDLSGDAAVGLTDVLTGVSPDYAVVAQKSAEPHVLATTGPVFQREYGLELTTLAQRYDKQLRAGAQVALVKAHEAEARINQAEARLAQVEMKASETETRAAQAGIKAGHAEARAGQAEIRASQAESRATHAEIKASQAEARAAHAEAEANMHQAEIRAAQAESIAREAATRAAEAEARAHQAAALAHDVAAQLGDVLASTSWRITKPLRWIRARLGSVKTLTRVARLFSHRNK